MPTPLPHTNPVPAGLPLSTSTEVAALDAEQEAWLVGMLHEAARLMGRRRRPDADDVVQEIALHTTPKVPRLMAQHPDPVVYARRRVQHAGISWDRTQRAQRGEGVRLHEAGDGLLHPGRQVVSGDAVGPEGAPGMFAHLLDAAAAFEDGLCDRLDAAALLQRTTIGIARADLREVLLVDGLGHEVQEVAATAGQARETVSRRVSRTRRRLREQVLGDTPVVAASG